MDAVSLMSLLFVVCDMHVCVCGYMDVLCVWYACVCVCVCGCMDMLCVWHACVRVWLYGCVVLCVRHACVCVCVCGCVVFSGTIKHLMKDVADPITTREGKSIFPVMKKLIQSTIPESELYIPNSKGEGGGEERRSGERRGGEEEESLPSLRILARSA